MTTPTNQTAPLVLALDEPLGEGVDPVLHEYAQLAYARNTRRAYNTAWRRFQAWCAAQGRTVLPATPTTVASYLHTLVQAGRSWSTINLTVCAIEYLHQRLPEPQRPPRFRENRDFHDVLRGVRAKTARPPRRVAAISVAGLREACRAMEGTPRGLRDRAILVVGFAAALRRSEIVGLQVGDAELVEEGIRLLVRESKTDHDHEGQEVGLPYGSDPATCPVRTLKAWLAHHPCPQDPTAPLFVSFADGRTPARPTAPMCGDAIRTLVQTAFGPAFSGHSLRAGFATAMAMAGAPIDEIAKQTRHRNPATVLRYIRRANLVRESPAVRLGL